MYSIQLLTELSEAVDYIGLKLELNGYEENAEDV